MKLEGDGIKQINSIKKTWKQTSFAGILLGSTSFIWFFTYISSNLRLTMKGCLKCDVKEISIDYSYNLFILALFSESPWWFYLVIQWGIKYPLRKCCPTKNIQRKVHTNLHRETISTSISRDQRDHSICTALIGCTAWARLIVSALASDNPMYLTIPSSTNFFSSPIYFIMICFKEIKKEEEINNKGFQKNPYAHN